MPQKNKGKKSKRKNKEATNFKRELIFKEDEQEYAQVIKLVGDGRLEAYCFDGVKRLCIIRGQMKKKIWIYKDDFILVGLRDYQNEIGDVIHKYNSDEARTLKAYGELPESVNIGSSANEQQEDLGKDNGPVEFVDDDGKDTEPVEFVEEEEESEQEEEEIDLDDL